jgi:hypothetical protein
MELIEAIPMIGWRNQPNAQVLVRERRTFKVTTDHDGWRGSGSIDTADLVVFGDSFAFGHGVDDADFFAHRVRDVRVKAAGVNGYNMVQQLLWMERLKERLGGKTVVWFVFYGNDLMDNLHPNFRHYRTPFVRARNGTTPETWEVVTDHVTAEPWPFDPHWGYRNQIAATCTPSYHSDRAFRACAALIDRARHLCDSAGARLAVVGIPDVTMLDVVGQKNLRHRSPDPDRFDPDLPDIRLAQICATRDVPFVPLSAVLGVHDHLPNDCHWTPRGHARVAAVIADIHRNMSHFRHPAASAAAAQAPAGARAFVLGTKARA